MFDPRAQFKQGSLPAKKEDPSLKRVECRFGCFCDGFESLATSPSLNLSSWNFKFYDEPLASITALPDCFALGFSARFVACSRMHGP
jgi:hypothetical protein